MGLGGEGGGGSCLRPRSVDVFKLFLQVIADMIQSICGRMAVAFSTAMHAVHGIDG